MPKYIITEECAEWWRYIYQIEANNKDAAIDAFHAGEAIPIGCGEHEADLDFPEREVTVKTDTT